MNDLIIKKINKRYKIRTTKRNIIDKEGKQIYKKYIRTDFYTNDEIKEICPLLQSKIANLMFINSEYNKKYEYYYNFLQEFKDGNINKYKCVFCNNYIFYKYKHYKKCQKLKDEYEESIYNTFYKFVNNNFKKETLDKLVLSEIYKHYIDKDFYYFINNIKDNIKYPVLFNDLNKNFTYKFKIKKFKTLNIENYQLNKFLNKLYEKIKLELNPRHKKKLRELSIENYKKNNNFNEKEIINEFKKIYNIENNIMKNEEENEIIINKIININNLKEEKSKIRIKIENLKEKLKNDEDNNKLKNKIEELEQEEENILVEKSFNEEIVEENEEDDEDDEDNKIEIRKKFFNFKTKKNIITKFILNK